MMSYAMRCVNILIRATCENTFCFSDFWRTRSEQEQESAIGNRQSEMSNGKEFSHS